MRREPQISKGIDWSLVWLCALLVCIGLLSIFAVQYRETDDITQVFLKGTKEYGKQLRWVIVCVVLAIIILLTDSKFFTATANLQYGFGLLLLLLVFPLHASVKGTNSIIRLGGFQLQPAELCKVFTLLALAKFLSRQDTVFTKPRAHLIAAAIVLVPAFITVAQKETGLALVYFSLFLAMYREGLPLFYIIFAGFIVVFVVSILLVAPNILTGIIIGVTLAILYINRKKVKRNRAYLFRVVAIMVLCIGFQRLALPAAWKLLPHHQTDRISSTLGIDRPAFAAANMGGPAPAIAASSKKEKQSDYNVKQSKIAIGSGGLLGKGFLNNTQTRFDFVPEQQTDFIFCAVAEGFGFIGSIILLSIYAILLWRITIVAERQRSAFSRVYAYGVASIIFFHFFVNLAMTMGLAPVIGIPLPFVSYGGTSLITFTTLLFILIRLDADRQMVLR
jgi:rod shape determining protein RodA